MHPLRCLIDYKLECKRETIGIRIQGGVSLIDYKLECKRKQIPGK